MREELKAKSEEGSGHLKAKRRQLKTLADGLDLSASSQMADPLSTAMGVNKKPDTFHGYLFDE